MIVEFFGCTSTGKSTIASRVFEKLKSAGMNVDFLDIHGNVKFDLISFPWFILYALKNYRFCVFAAKTISQGAESRIVGLNLFRNYAKKMGMYQLLRTKMREEILIWDEGTMHSAHNLLVHVGNGPRFDDIRRFSTMVPKPDLGVYVKAPIEETIQRSFDRGHRRVRHYLPDTKRFIRHACETFDFLVTCADIRGKVFIVENTCKVVEGIDEVVDKVVRKILADLMVN
jgi:thymidylate kinase